MIRPSQLPAEHDSYIPHFPIALRVEGRRVVVIGTDAVAEQKAAELEEAGAHVVTAPSFTPGLLRGAFLAVSTLLDPALNEPIWREAEEERVLLNAIDDIPHCHVIAPAIHRVGPVSVAISTGGTSPALAVKLKQSIQKVVRPEHGALASMLGELRPRIKRLFPDMDVRKALWHSLVASTALGSLRRGNRDQARRTIERIIRDTLRNVAQPSRAGGVVHLVGAGPGDPKLITRRGYSLLRHADVVVHDALVSPTLLREARNALLIDVGKRGYDRATQQSYINDLLIKHARRGRRVVRLKGGDPFIFGRGAEELATLRNAGIRSYVVPGVSAATSVPGAAGIPLTHRDLASGFAVVTAEKADRSLDLDWNALAKIPTLVVMMGVRRLDATAQKLIAGGLDPDTPAAVIANGTLPNQREVHATVGTIASAAARAGIESPAVTIIGNVVALAPKRSVHTRLVHANRLSETKALLPS